MTGNDSLFAQSRCGAFKIKPDDARLDEFLTKAKWTQLPTGTEFADVLRALMKKVELSLTYSSRALLKTKSWIGIPKQNTA